VAISGVGVGMAAAGGLMAYAGFTGQTIPDALRGIAKGSVVPVRDQPTEKYTVTPLAGDPSKTTVTSPYFAAGGSVLADAALKYVGRPYQWGRNFDPPAGGGDCSGLLYRAFHDLGWMTPRLSSYGYLTWSAVRRVTAASPGVILWWPGHVAIAIGQGNMVEAPTIGIPVRVTPIRAGYIALQPQLDALSRYVYTGSPLKGPI